MNISLDFSHYGALDGLYKFVKITGWYVGSAVVATLIAYSQGYNLANEHNILVVASVWFLNATGAGVQTWLNSHKPESPAKDPAPVGEVSELPAG